MPTKARPHSAAQSSHVARARPRVDIERFRADLREGGVEEMVGVLLATFVEDCPGRFAAFEQAVHEGNAEAAASAAHAFKSGAGTVRATVLADTLSKAETAARAGDLESVAPLVEQIREEYLAVVRELEATLSDAG